MKSNIIEKTLSFKVNNTNVDIKFHMYCNIIVTSMYNDDTLSHQFVLEPNMFYNYEECKYELLFVINKFLGTDFNLQELDKDELIKVNNNHIVNILSQTIDEVLSIVSNQKFEDLSDEDTHIKLLFDFINLKENKN